MSYASWYDALSSTDIHMCSIPARDEQMHVDLSEETSKKSKMKGILQNN